MSLTVEQDEIAGLIEPNAGEPAVINRVLGVLVRRHLDRRAHRDVGAERQVHAHLEEPVDLAAGRGRGRVGGHAQRAAPRPGGIIGHGDREHRKGKATGVVPQDKVDAIDKLFATAHYFDFGDSDTHYEVTDNPSAITSWHHGCKVKTIEHHYGDTHVPQALTQLEKDLDELIGIERWIGTHDERKQLAGRGR